MRAWSVVTTRDFRAALCVLFGVFLAPGIPSTLMIPNNPVIMDRIRPAIKSCQVMCNAKAFVLIIRTAEFSLHTSYIKSRVSLLRGSGMSEIKHVLVVCLKFQKILISFYFRIQTCSC